MWHFQAQGDCKNVSKQIALLPNRGPAELFSAREHEVSLRCRQPFTILGSVTLKQSVWLTCRILCVRCTYWNCRSGCKNKNYSLFRCANIGLKGWPAYKQQARKFETNSFQSMTWSHCCWFITNTWKSDHCLNDTWHRHKICCQLSVC